MGEIIVWPFKKSKVVGKIVAKSETNAEEVARVEKHGGKAIQGDWLGLHLVIGFLFPRKKKK